MVFPYFNYCNIIWGGAANTHINQLVLLQKKCIRNVCKVGYFDHTDELFEKLKLLKIDQIYQLSCGKFMYQCYNNSNYAKFRQRLVPHNSFHDYETRTKDKLVPLFERLHQFDKSPLNVGITIWNKLPDKIKLYKPLVSFKPKLKAHILKHIHPISNH